MAMSFHLVLFPEPNVEVGMSEQQSLIFPVRSGGPT
jgi:hypothetical protein